MSKTRRRHRCILPHDTTFKFMTNLKKLATITLTNCMLSLSSCSMIDPEFKAALGNADTHASRQEILGMWFHGSSLMNTKIRESILFRQDGTGIARRYLEGQQPATAHFQWTYEGGGKWKVVASSEFPYPTEWFIAGDKLLESMDRGIFGMRNIVYYREDGRQAFQQNLNR
jgi:hypothetical protein